MNKSIYNIIISNIISFLLILLTSVSVTTKTEVFAKNTNKYKMAIVIDDFGYDRQGVFEMLSLPCKLTCAVLPALPYTEVDANTAHSQGHEVILHMPMETTQKLPDDWYGPMVIRNSDSAEIASKKTVEALSMVPHAVGMNIHMGTGVSSNETLMSSIMQTAKDQGMYFLDSRTTMQTVCAKVNTNVQCNFVYRDIFLEAGGPDYNTSLRRIDESIALAKEKGYAIIIGHIGPMGKTATYNALKDSLQKIYDNNIAIVPLSEIAFGMGEKNII